jgi:hypothetical protein
MRPVIAGRQGLSQARRQPDTLYGSDDRDQHGRAWTVEGPTAAVSSSGSCTCPIPPRQPPRPSPPEQARSPSQPSQGNAARPSGTPVMTTPAPMSTTPRASTWADCRCAAACAAWWASTEARSSPACCSIIRRSSASPAAASCLALSISLNARTMCSSRRSTLSLKSASGSRCRPEPPTDSLGRRRLPQAVTPWTFALRRRNGRKQARNARILCPIARSATQIQRPIRTVPSGAATSVPMRATSTPNRRTQSASVAAGCTAWQCNTTPTSAQWSVIPRQSRAGGMRRLSARLRSLLCGQGDRCR